MTSARAGWLIRDARGQRAREDARARDGMIILIIFLPEHTKVSRYNEPCVRRPLVSPLAPGIRKYHERKYRELFFYAARFPPPPPFGRSLIFRRVRSRETVVLTPLKLLRTFRNPIGIYG